MISKMMEMANPRAMEALAVLALGVGLGLLSWATLGKAEFLMGPALGFFVASALGQWLSIRGMRAETETGKGIEKKEGA